MSKYEAAYSDVTNPGCYFIEYHGDAPHTSIDVVRIPTLQVQGRLLACEYEILSDTMTDSMACALIAWRLLKDLCSDYYKASADKIVFVNLKTGACSTLAYPAS